ncbi:hypothetical protein [Nocardiopsis sp. MG754419]|uniref:hypothetical protein n=1 Tax=Nocardiopsis sp. MG754419 TaxID=2259865 RepID=UPI001BA82B37|nr:hypothetical protein [Nocardiopsis sp. MG754419]MBR8743934.1 hypothetical protein [Nocardiopsis sp. MG754419]
MSFQSLLSLVLTILPAVAAIAGLCLLGPVDRRDRALVVPGLLLVVLGGVLGLIVFIVMTGFGVVSGSLQVLNVVDHLSWVLPIIGLVPLALAATRGTPVDGPGETRPTVREGHS